MAETKGFHSWTNLHKAQYIKGPNFRLHLFHPKAKWAAVIPSCYFATFHSSVSINPKGFCVYIEASTLWESSKCFCLSYHTIKVFFPLSAFYSLISVISQNHRMVKVEWELWRWTCPNPPAQAGSSRVSCLCPDGFWINIFILSKIFNQQLSLKQIRASTYSRK